MTKYLNANNTKGWLGCGTTGALIHGRCGTDSLEANLTVSYKAKSLEPAVALLGACSKKLKLTNIQAFVHGCL